MTQRGDRLVAPERNLWSRLCGQSLRSSIIPLLGLLSLVQLCALVPKTRQDSRSASLMHRVHCPTDVSLHFARAHTQLALRLRGGKAVEEDQGKERKEKRKTEERSGGGKKIKSAHEADGLPPGGKSTCGQEINGKDVNNKKKREGASWKEKKKRDLLSELKRREKRSTTKRKRDDEERRHGQEKNDRTTKEEGRPRETSTDRAAKGKHGHKMRRAEGREGKKSAKGEGTGRDAAPKLAGKRTRSNALKTRSKKKARGSSKHELRPPRRRTDKGKGNALAREERLARAGPDAPLSDGKDRARGLASKEGGGAQQSLELDKQESTSPPEKGMALARNLLRKMGWSGDGHGLGKHESGRCRQPFAPSRPSHSPPPPPTLPLRQKHPQPQLAGDGTQHSDARALRPET
jgi:hypothetical protein